MGLDLTPAVEFSGGGRMAETLKARLIKVEIVDSSGIESDSLSVDIFGEGLSDWPDGGKDISVRIGYVETGLRDMGTYTLTRISEQLPQRVLTLTFTAAKFQVKNKTDFNLRRSATYKEKSIGDIVSEIAGRHGYSSRVADEFSKISIEQINQDNETDMQFLHRIAKKYDAVCKPTDQHLVFGRRGEIKSLSGRQLSPVVIEYAGHDSPGMPMFSQAAITSVDRKKHSGVKARWRDAGAAESVEIEIGEAPYRSLPTVYKTEEEAKQNAEAALRQSQREGDSLTLDCPGNPRIAAEGLLEMKSFPSARANVVWSCDRVTHTYQKTGYRTRVEATLPNRK